MPTVSVIIPNYNHAPYLKERIDSVLNQTFQDFEVLILDDKSTDNSREIIEQYRNHPKISHIIYNKVNSGSTFKQWNKGIELAKGEWIWIAESDDWCKRNFLRELMTLLSQDNSVAIAYCQSITLLPNNKLLIREQIEPEVKRIKKEDFLNNYLLKGNCIYNASMAIFNKSLFYKIKRKEYLNYKFCGDWIFWAELSKYGDVIRYSKLLNYFRKDGEIDVSSKVLKDGLNLIEDVNALGYFQKELNVNYTSYIRQIKKYYFEFKNNIYPEATQKLIKENFIKEVGKKRLFIWDIKYIKQNIAERIYTILREKI